MRLGEAEAEILGQVIHEMRAQVGMEERPQHLWRLFPPAYKDDDEAQSEFARLTTDDLLAQKARALDDVTRMLARGRVKRGVWVTQVEDEEVHSLLGSLQDARLALGTRLDVTEEMEDEPFDDADPNAFAYGVYRWLGMLQSYLIDELLDA